MWFSLFFFLLFPLLFCRRPDGDLQVADELLVTQLELIIIKATCDSPSARHQLVSVLAWAPLLIALSEKWKSSTLTSSTSHRVEFWSQAGLWFFSGFQQATRLKPPSPLTVSLRIHSRLLIPSDSTCKKSSLVYLALNATVSSSSWPRYLLFHQMAKLWQRWHSIALQVCAETRTSCWARDKQSCIQSWEPLWNTLPPARGCT